MGNTLLLCPAEVGAETMRSIWWRSKADTQSGLRIPITTILISIGDKNIGMEEEEGGFNNAFTQSTVCDDKSG